MVTTLPERLRFLPDAVDIRPVLAGSSLRIDQAAVAVNRRQAVAELVRDAGGQLAEARQRLLQPQLLLELDDVGQVREQADDAAAAAPAAAKRRHGDAESATTGRDRGSSTVRRTIGAPRSQTLGDDASTSGGAAARSSR